MERHEDPERTRRFRLQQLEQTTHRGAQVKPKTPRDKTWGRQFSGYIDAVGGRMHASSFTQDEGVMFNPHMAHFGPYLVETWKKITAYRPEGAYTYKHRLEVVQA